MRKKIPDNHLYIHDNIDIYTISLRLKTDVIVDIHMYIIANPIESKDLAHAIYPMAHCIQDMHDIIRQRYPNAEYNLTLEFNYSSKNLFTSEGWRIHTQSTNPSVVTQDFIRRPNNRGRYQLRCVDPIPVITPTKTFIACTEENTPLFDAHYQFIHAHPNIIWYESGMCHRVLFPYVSNAELEVVFYHSDTNALVHTIKLHISNYEITIKANMTQQAIDTLINETPITDNISQHEYVALMRWLQQLPLTYDEQIAPVVTKATTLFHAHYTPPHSIGQPND